MKRTRVRGRDVTGARSRAAAATAVPHASRVARFVAACLLAASRVAAQGTSEPPAPDVVFDAPPPGKLAALAADFELLEGLRAELVAAEPLLQHPVAFAVDEQGDVYVAETHRHHQGVTDIREHVDWLDDDLAAQTVADRLAYMRRRTGEHFDDYAANADRVRLLRDTDGDGRFDAAHTFAGDFSSHAAGIGAGLLARDGEVTYACIPSLWRLRDSTGDGVADERRELSTGYGVRISLLGHDLHGVVLGPDGRLWFSIGDRGLHVETEHGVLALPDQGAVLRCEPDGSDLQLVHVGLRNPQELAFDEFGDLFTVDNNSDGGDRARVVQILPGADSGWRQPFQWLDDRGPWKLEDWWRAEQHDVPFRLPPLAHLASGPSGLVHDPGELFPAPFTGGFLLADFLGDPGSSAVVGFRLEPDGAGYAMTSSGPFVRGVLATDVDVDTHGRVLVSDWVTGWNRNAKGRLWRFEHGDDERAAEGARRAAEFARAFAERDDVELLALLADPDRRLRDRAHLELAARESAWPALARLVEEHDALRPRWHALAALGVAARRHEPALARHFAAHTLDREPELRALALDLLGESAPDGAAGYVSPRLADEHPRVRLHAALAAAELRAPTLGDALLARLRGADADDAHLLHALSLALARCVPADALLVAADGAPRGVRLGALLALRRLGDPRLTRFLADADLDLRDAAARALWDTGLAHAHAAVAEALAAELERAPPVEGERPALLRRALGAAAWIGDARAAERLLDFALREEHSTELRGLALDTVVDWAEPSTRDPVLGAWQPRDGRDTAALPELLRARALRELADAPSALLSRWVRLVADHELRGAAPMLRAVLRSRRLPGTLRAKAFDALGAWSQSEREALTAWALGDRSADLRAAALAVLPELGTERVLEALPKLMTEGTLLERRVAFALAAGLDDPRGEALLLEQWQARARGELPLELELDLIQALPPDAGEELRALRREALGGERIMRLDGPPSALMYGGRRESGARVFERSELSCVRCHAREGEGLDDLFVGPSLEGVGERLGRAQLLEALLEPNARLAPGFENTHLFLDDGALLTGRVLTETGVALVVLDADGERHEVPTARVSERRPALSAMPEGLVASLTPRELRDLIAYLAEL